MVVVGLLDSQPEVERPLVRYCYIMGCCCWPGSSRIRGMNCGFFWCCCWSGKGEINGWSGDCASGWIARLEDGNAWSRVAGGRVACIVLLIIHCSVSQCHHSHLAWHVRWTEQTLKFRKVTTSPNFCNAARINLLSERELGIGSAYICTDCAATRAREFAILDCLRFRFCRECCCDHLECSKREKIIVEKWYHVKVY